MGRRGWFRRRRGMSLIEVVIALVILGVVMLGMGEFVGRFVRGTRESLVLQTASDLAIDRLERVKGSPTYTGLTGFARTEQPVAGFPGYKRVTQVARTQTTKTDYFTVTVTVTGPGMARPIKKTTMIARF